jgi:hypothetical protein
MKFELKYQELDLEIKVELSPDEFCRLLRHREMKPASGSLHEVDLTTAQKYGTLTFAIMEMVMAQAKGTRG